MILTVPVGVGKTHAAQALGHQAIRYGADVRFAKTSRILAETRRRPADHSWARRLRELVRPQLLMLDDFGMRELTAAQADDLYELINERAGRSLLLTSNRSAVDWYPLFPQPRRRRVPARPADQHQPPHPHERRQLTPEQAPRPRPAGPRRASRVEPPPRTGPYGIT